MVRKIPLGAVCFQEFSGDYLDFIDLAYDLEFSWIEFKFELPIRDRPGSRRYAEIRDRARNAGIRTSLHTPFSGLNIASLDPDHRTRSLLEVKASIDAACEMEISLATLHSGHLPSIEYSADNWEASRAFNLSSINALADYARQRGVGLCLENVNIYNRASLKHGAHPGDLKLIRECVGEDLSFTVDFGHALFMSRDPSYLVSELGRDVVRLSHIHSNAGIADTHDPLGTGVLRLQSVMDRYVTEEWEFPLLIEMKNTEDLRASVEVFTGLALGAGYELTGKERVASVGADHRTKSK